MIPDDIPRYIFVTCPHCQQEIAWRTKTPAPIKCPECLAELFSLVQVEEKRSF